MGGLGHGRHHHDGEDHARRPYWKHAHRDWRFWVAVVFIFAALTIYVMSDDLALVHRAPPPAPTTTQPQ